MSSRLLTHALTARTLVRRTGLGGAIALSVAGGAAFLPAAHPAAAALARPAAPALSLAAAVSEPLISQGSTGPAVALAQRLLHVSADGQFGPITLAAVRSFQASRHLTTDGVVGPVTWSVLLGTPAAAAPSAAAPAVQAAPASVSLASPTLQEGATGSAVAQVQRMLHVSADGQFGPITLAAVRSFQASRHLATDGVVGPLTWAALRGAGSVTLAPASYSRPTVLSTPAPAASLGQQAVGLAAQQQGKPYLYGGAGPNAFDCSGLVSYVYGRLGHALPHNADAIFHALRQVPQADAQPGDVISIPDASGYVTHDGIYAGGGLWWVAPHTGTTVSLQSIYTSNYYVSRVG